MNTERIAVVGLGYVGLPLAIALAKHFKVIGYDLNKKRIEALHQGIDESGELGESALVDSRIRFTCQSLELANCNFFIVAVPTPVDASNQPDLTALVKASAAIGCFLKPGDVVVYESTVYPGVTENVCGPVLASKSGLTPGVDFHLAYSPERVSPGDSARTLSQVVKIVAGDDAATTERVRAVYATVVEAGIYCARSIAVAEAAKVLENIQRDVNIALMNEAAIIFERLGIKTADVLAAAGTKWNFLPFSPGLVGGHCIGVDPYYLTYRAEQLGIDPALILSARSLNDRMGRHVAERLVDLLQSQGVRLATAKVAVLGLTFKEDVRDLRNSRVGDVISELKRSGISPLVHDEVCDRFQAAQMYGVNLIEWDDLQDGELDAIVLAVPHQAYRQAPKKLLAKLKPNGIFMDVKAVVPPDQIPPDVLAWSL